MPELVRTELKRIAARPSALEWLDLVSRPVVTNQVDAVAALDEIRGEWPDAGR